MSDHLAACHPKCRYCSPFAPMGDVDGMTMMELRAHVSWLLTRIERVQAIERNYRTAWTQGPGLSMGLILADLRAVFDTEDDHV